VVAFPFIVKKEDFKKLKSLPIVIFFVFLYTSASIRFLPVAVQIAQSGAQMLFVAITSTTKENFLYKHSKLLKSVNLIMGVGGSFDVISGKTKRAPLWMQKIGLEWFYRFLQEPNRMWKRYLIGNSKFIFLVLKERFSK